MDDGQAVRIVLRLSEDDVRRIAERTADELQRRRLATVESPYMTIEEAAAYLRCRRQRIDDLLSQRRLKRVKDGARTLIARADLEVYLSTAAGTDSAAVWDSAA